MKAYLSTLNQDITLFQEDVIMDGLRDYLAGNVPRGNGVRISLISAPDYPCLP